MKHLMIVMLIAFSTTMSFASIKQASCTGESSKLNFSLEDIKKGIKVDQKDSRLKFELGSLEELRTLSVNKIQNGWIVVTMANNNHDDSNFIATLVLDSNMKNARLSIQVLVDGIEGGTYSEAFECDLK